MGASKAVHCSLFASCMHIVHAAARNFYEAWQSWPILRHDKMRVSLHS